jgi:alkyldihydroxyacetonephosphate synthase
MMARRRSIWAWGFEDRQPAPAALSMLAARLSSVLGGPPLVPMPAPDEAAIQLSPPTIAPPDDIARFCTSDDRERMLHTRGRSFPDIWRSLHGDFRTAPDLVAHPATEDDLAALMVFAAYAGLDLVPWGGGTSVVGGVEVPLPRPRPVITVDMGAFTVVRDVDPISRRATVGAGLTGPALEAALGAHGLTLRHYPQSFEFSTVGGWVATRAGGHFATVYTHIDDLVAGVRMVTPAGPFETRSLPASGAGPAPERLVLGSEGALGFITEATLRVRPRPTRRADAVVQFEGWEEAVAATRAVAQSGLFPSNCRLLDRREAALNMVGPGVRHLLLLAFESDGAPVAARLENALALATAAGGTCPKGPRLRDEGQDAEKASAGDAWRGAFLEAPYLFSSLIRLGAVVDTFETAVSWADFPALHAAVKAAVHGAFDAAGVKGLLTTRFTHVYTDGPAPYYTFITAPPAGGDPLALWQAVKVAASDALLAHGATITHHHAVGRTHAPWFSKEVPVLHQRALEAVKGTLDPAGILNPGVLGLGGR